MSRSSQGSRFSRRVLADNSCMCQAQEAGRTRALFGSDVSNMNLLLQAFVTLNISILAPIFQIALCAQMTNCLQTSVTNSFCQLVLVSGQGRTRVLLGSAVSNMNQPSSLLFFCVFLFCVPSVSAFMSHQTSFAIYISTQATLFQTSLLQDVALDDS